MDLIGDIVEYSTEETSEGNQLIPDLSTSVQYSIQKLIMTILD